MATLNYTASPLPQAALNTQTVIKPQPANMSAADSKTLEMYGEIWKQANAAGDKGLMESAHQAAEALRAGYGYSGGADGSQYIQLNQGLPYQTAPQYSSYTDYYSNNGYDALEAQARQQIGAQTSSAVQQLNAQKEGISMDSDELSRQAYISYMRSREALPQALAALGYTGGLSETRQVELESSLMDRQHQIGQQKQRLLTALDTAILEAQSSGQAELGKLLADLRLQSQGQWNSYQSQQSANARDDYWKQQSFNQQNLTNLTNLSNSNYWNAQDYSYQLSRDQLLDSRYLLEQEQKRLQQELENQMNQRKLDLALKELLLRYS